MSFSSACDRYFKKRNNKVINFIKRQAPAYKEEDYHDLRVEIKKIRAFLRLLADTTGLEEKIFFKPYKKIFKGAGKVRDLQVANRLLKKERPSKWLTLFRNELKTEVKNLETDFSVTISKAARRRLEDIPLELNPFLKKLTRTKVDDHLAREKGKARVIAGKDRIKVNEAHCLRIKLKRLGYNQKLIKENKGSKELDVIQERLGDWHDHEMLEECIQTHLRNTIGKQQKTHLSKMKREIAARRKKMFQQITASLKELSL